MVVVRLNGDDDDFVGGGNGRETITLIARSHPTVDSDNRGRRDDCTRDDGYGGRHCPVDPVRRR